MDNILGIDTVGAATVTVDAEVWAAFPLWAPAPPDHDAFLVWDKAKRQIVWRDASTVAEAPPLVWVAKNAERKS